jgi:hypothetical protein
MYRQSEHEGGKVFSPTHRPSLPPGRIPGTHFITHYTLTHYTVPIVWPKYDKGIV